MTLIPEPTDEDREDARNAEAALAEPGKPVPAEELWAELGLADPAAGDGTVTGEGLLP